MANAAGDVDLTHDFFLLPVTKTAVSAIAKGDIVQLNAFRTWAPGDKGPFGVAREAIAAGADMKGKVLLNGVVWVTANAAINQFDPVTPAASNKVATAVAETSSLAAGAVAVTSTSANPTPTLAGSLPPAGMILGLALDAASALGSLLRISMYGV